MTPPLCVLCAARNRETRLESGHCCAACRVRIDDNLRDIVTMGDQTAAEPPSGGSSGAMVTESRPPTDLDRCAPYLALVNVAGEPATIAELLLGWERIVRQERRLAWVGNATEGHVGNSEAVLAAKSARASVATLRAHLEWITTAPNFPLEDFAREIAACSKRMFTLALNLRGRDRVVECPTITDERDEDGQLKSCGYRLTIRTWLPLEHRDDNGREDKTIGEDVTCKRCGATRSMTQLIHAAGKDAAWADAEAIGEHYGIGASTLRRWAANGHIRRDRGRFNVGDVVAWRDNTERGSA